MIKFGDFNVGGLILLLSGLATKINKLDSLSLTDLDIIGVNMLGSKSDQLIVLLLELFLLSLILVELLDQIVDFKLPIDDGSLVQGILRLLADFLGPLLLVGL